MALRHGSGLEQVLSFVHRRLTSSGISSFPRRNFNPSLWPGASNIGRRFVRTVGQGSEDHPCLPRGASVKTKSMVNPGKAALGHMHDESPQPGRPSVFSNAPAQHFPMHGLSQMWALSPLYRMTPPQPAGGVGGPVSPYLSSSNPMSPLPAHMLPLMPRISLTAAMGLELQTGHLAAHMPLSSMLLQQGSHEEQHLLGLEGEGQIGIFAPFGRSIVNQDYSAHHHHPRDHDRSASGEHAAQNGENSSDQHL